MIKAIIISLLLVSTAFAETTTTIKPEQKIIELKARLFDTQIQIEQLNKQKAEMLNELVRMIQEQQAKK